MTGYNFHRVFARSARLGVASFLVASAVFLAASAALAGDMIRVVESTETDVEEKTIDGTILSISRDGVEFESKSKKTTTYSPDRIVWLMFEGEPLELSAARVELEVGNYEEALEKLNGIDEASLSNASDDVRREIAWNKGVATAKLAFSEGADLKSAGVALVAYVKEGGSHYRYYEANALLGDLCRALNKAKDAEKYYGRLDDAESESVRARGKVGRGDLALASGDAEGAKALFAEASGEELKPLEPGADVRAAARVGLARAASQQGEGAEAEKTLEELLAALPNGATLLQARTNNALGETLAANGKPQEAIVARLRVDLLYPAARAERVEALKALVPLWREVGRDDRAVETIERLRERFGVELD